MDKTFKKGQTITLTCGGAYEYGTYGRALVLKDFDESIIDPIINEIEHYNMDPDTGFKYASHYTADFLIKNKYIKILKDEISLYLGE